MNKEKYLDTCEKNICLEDLNTQIGCEVSSPLFELSDRFKALKDKKKEIEATLKAVNETIFEIETALAELMTISETQNFTRRDRLHSNI